MLRLLGIILMGMGLVLLPRSTAASIGLIAVGGLIFHLARQTLEIRKSAKREALAEVTLMPQAEITDSNATPRNGTPIVVQHQAQQNLPRPPVQYRAAQRPRVVYVQAPTPAPEKKKQDNSQGLGCLILLVAAAAVWFLVLQPATVRDEIRREIRSVPGVSRIIDIAFREVEATGGDLISLSAIVSPSALSLDTAKQMWTKAYAKNPALETFLVFLSDGETTYYYGYDAESGNWHAEQTNLN